MHKKLHKDLYLKRNKKKTYPPLNNKSLILTEKLLSETLEKDTVEIKKNKYYLPIFTSLIVSSLIIFGYAFYNSSSQSNINLLSVDPQITITDNSITSTTTTFANTTSTSSTTTSSTITTTTTSVAIVVQNISDAQNQLMILGLYSGEINNVLDNETKAALKEFQRLAGLSVDGILGPKTKAALEKGEDSYVDIGGADVNDVGVIIYSKEIENVQQTLKELNLYTGEIDGINGIGTDSAIVLKCRNKPSCVGLL